MAKNICPVCAQVTLTLKKEEEIRCPICENRFTLNDRANDS